MSKSTNRRRLFPLVITAALSSSCAGPDRSAEFDALGSFVDSLAVEYGVPGVGFALFDASGLLYEHVGGVKSQATLEPIDTNTAFEAASISKPVFAYVVFSLARDGLLNLDAPLETLVPEVPDVANDPRSAALTPRILLTHLGGLPNWRSRINFAARSHEELFAADDTLRFVQDPGTEYLYSGEGYVLLQRIVEEITGQSLIELARERVFEPLGMARSSFLFDAEMRTNYSLGHDGEGNPDKWEIALPLASSTLHTTAADLAGFGAHLASEIREGGPYAELGTPAVTIDGVLDEVDETDDGAVVHGWGQGLGVVTDGGRRYIYHGGNNVIFIADFIYGVEENMGYVLLTNSSNGRQMVEALELRVFGRDLRP
jgi:CubicO group peptidase (beta-lactamase class C family)